MSIKFEETDGNYEGSICVALGNTPLRFKVTKHAIPGYICRHLEDCDGEGPLGAATRAYGTLWYGNQHPDLILSSEDMMNNTMRKFKPGAIRPVMYGNNSAFFFNGAIWSYPEDRDFDKEWVFMLNTKNPLNFQLNGCYRPLI